MHWWTFHLEAIYNSVASVIASFICLFIFWVTFHESNAHSFWAWKELGREFLVFRLTRLMQRALLNCPLLSIRGVVCTRPFLDIVVNGHDFLQLCTLCPSNALSWQNFKMLIWFWHRAAWGENLILWPVWQYMWCRTLQEQFLQRKQLM